ncbi:MAG: hypothetical protein C5B48_03900 [Candidatus Rokuibacteriota bacterium]|nr:MAG: hypothetical protein C5B48_03900 [Candidatus Rokubacteria bacterium]
MGPGRTLFGLVALLSVAAAIAAAGSQARTASYIPSQQAEVPSCDPFGTFSPSRFPDKPTDNNRYLPLKPGNQYVYQGRANRGGGLLPHTIVFTVTDLTKVIDGVHARVLWDVDENVDTVQETELSFFAEDTKGNIWLMGEYPEEYDNGVFKGAPVTWLSGIVGSKAGVQVPAVPKLSGPSYIQGLAPEVGFFDCAKDIVRFGSTQCVQVGCFNNLYVTEEWNPNDPLGGFQTKTYAPNVGNISIGAVDDPEGETLELSQINKLDKAGLAAARVEALKLDTRGYLVSEVYAQTDPAEPGGKRPPPPAPVPPAQPPVASGPAPAPPGTGLTPSQVAKKQVHKKKKKRKRCVAKRKRGSKQHGSKSKRPRCGSRKHARPKRR